MKERFFVIIFQKEGVVTEDGIKEIKEFQTISQLKGWHRKLPEKEVAFRLKLGEFGLEEI